MTTLSVETRRESALSEESKRGLGMGVSAWKWMAVACVLLAISGGIRFWRDYQFQTKVNQAAASPFPVKDLPAEIGTWRLVDGSDSQLDPQIARLAGSTDHVVRTYVDSKTGERATALVIYGFARNMSPHVPEVCFPATGYSFLKSSWNDRRFELPELGMKGTLRTAFYKRGTTARVECVEVSHTFLFGDTWVPEIQSHWKEFRYHPGSFKIQVQRELPGIPSDENVDDLLTESFCKLLAEEISKRLHAGASETAPAAAQKTTPVKTTRVVPSTRSLQVATRP